MKPYLIVKFTLYFDIIEIRDVFCKIIFKPQTNKPSII